MDDVDLTSRPVRASTEPHSDDDHVPTSDSDDTTTRLLPGGDDDPDAPGGGGGGFRERRCAGLTIPLLLCTLLVVFSSVQFGYGLGSFNTAEYFIPVLVSNGSFPNVIVSKHNKTCGHMNSFFRDCVPIRSNIYWSAIVAVFSVGGFIGGLTGGPISSLRVLGRLWTLWLAAIGFLAAYAFEGLGSSFATLVVGRVLQGLCSGIVSGVAPMYLTEVTPTRLRGAFGVLVQMGIVIGSFLGMAISIGVRKASWWRSLFAWIAVIPMIQLVVLPCLPASPKWLISNGKTRLARKSLTRLRYSRGHRGRQMVDEELKTLIAQGSQGGPKSRLQMPCGRVILHLFIAGFLQVTQQFSGVNAVVFYSTKIFYAAGIPFKPEIATAIVGFVTILAVLPSVLLVEWAGRRKMLIIGMIAQSISMVVLTLSMTFTDYCPKWFKHPHTATTAFGIISVLGVCGLRISFQLGLGPIPWFFATEIVTTKWVPVAQAIACGCNWACTFIVAFAFPDMITYMTHFSLLPFIVYLVFALVVIIFLVPETRNKDIREVLGIPLVEEDPSSEEFDPPDASVQ